MKSFPKRIYNKFKYAFEGLFHGIAHDRSICIQVIFAIIVLIAGVILHLTMMEWCFITFAIALVITLEFINSALEHVVDMISPKYHPIAKIIKDYAAAAVLVTSIMAAVIGILIFGGKLLW